MNHPSSFLPLLTGLMMGVSGTLAVENYRAGHAPQVSPNIWVWIAAAGNPYACVLRVPRDISGAKFSECAARAGDLGQTLNPTEIIP